MIYGSVCSGIEAATVAWEPLGWHAAWFAEVDPFPSAVLAHHYPNIPNLGDFTQIGAGHEPVDLLVGGTPCEDFSIAGLRRGLAGENGNLAIEFLRLAERIRPCWLVWENVPNVLSIDRGRALGTFLGALAECGYGWAYRVLDAQYFGVAQRRRRVFVVGYLGDWRPPAAVLFERESLSGIPAPRRGEGASVAGTITQSPYGDDCGGESVLVLSNAQGEPNWAADVALTLDAGHQPQVVAFDWQAGHGIDAQTGKDRQYIVRAGDYTGAVGATRRDAVAVFDDPRRFDERHRGGEHGDLHPTLGSQMQTVITERVTVRRLTPIEVERLQGFPDGYTLVPYGKRMMSDSRRYQMLGKSMAVPVMQWIGKRISQVQAILGPMRSTYGTHTGSVKP